MKLTSSGQRRAATATIAATAGDGSMKDDASRSFMAGVPAWGAAYEPKEHATKALKALIDSDAAIASAFSAAVQRVARLGIPELRLIETLDQFYFYIDRLVTWVPEIRVWEHAGQTYHERTVYLRIVQLYYYFNQPELNALQSPIKPIEGKVLTPVSRWLRDFAVAWGRFLDTPRSAERLATFMSAPEYAWQDYERAPRDYKTFNEFFSRCFRDIDVQRPVAQVADDRIICFPAESTFVGQWAVSTRVKSGPLPAPPSITVKHIQWPIEELLADSAHAEAFEGGLFCHSFLNTYDYHRLHAPVRGKVVEARFIPGQVYLQVDLKRQGAALEPNPDLANAVIPTRYLDAEDPTGYQFVQCRGLLVLDNPVLGKVAVLPMGMAQVSSVVFTGPGPEHRPIVLSPEERDAMSHEEQVAAINARLQGEVVGRDMAKGEMFSFFQFGGSDCCVVFERRAGVAITAQRGVHYPIRSQYGQANFNP